MMIKPEFIQRVKDEVDIVRVISAFVDLKKRGTSHIGCCPFHNEKSPSFNVNPTRHSFKCFGCGESGNAIDFLMRHQNLTFQEAIQYAASTLNLDVEYESPDRSPSRFAGLRLR